MKLFILTLIVILFILVATVITQKYIKNLTWKEAFRKIFDYFIELF